MEEEAEDDPHGHITSLAVKRSHRLTNNETSNLRGFAINIIVSLFQETWFGSEAYGPNCSGYG